jgi:hypothetical protein
MRSLFRISRGQEVLLWTFADPPWISSTVTTHTQTPILQVSIGHALWLNLSLWLLHKHGYMDILRGLTVPILSQTRDFTVSRFVLHWGFL